MSNAKITNRVHELVSSLDGLYSCSVESLRKIRLVDAYNIELHFENDVSLDALKELEDVFKAPVTISSGFKTSGYCDSYYTESFIAVSISEATIPN